MHDNDWPAGSPVHRSDNRGLNSHFGIVTPHRSDMRVKTLSGSGRYTEIEMFAPASVDEIVIHFEGGTRETRLLNVRVVYQSREAVASIPLEDQRSAASIVMSNISGRSIGTQESTSIWRALDPTKELGTELFNRVFAGPCRDLYTQALKDAEGPDNALAIRLHIADDLSPAIPWELLFDPMRDAFVALSSRSPVIRATSDRRLEPLTGPLRVLLASADTNYLAEPQRDREVFEQLEKEHPNDFLQVDVLERASMNAFAGKLRSAAYNIIHFSGSGSASPTLPALSFFSDDYSRTDFVSAEALLPLLVNQPELRVMFLSADYTDQLARLLSPSVPLCIGIRELLSAASAATFARALYSTLLTAWPVSLALTRARQQLDADNPGVRDWALITPYTAGGALRPGVQPNITLDTPQLIISTDRSRNRNRLKVEREIAIHETNLHALAAQRLSPLAPEWRELEKQADGIKSTIAKLRANLMTMPE